MERKRTRRLVSPPVACLALVVACLAPPRAVSSGEAPPPEPDDVGLDGWLSWRGPDQVGTSPETDLFSSVTVGGERHLWSFPMAGRGTPAIAHGRVFGRGYTGEGSELQEVLFCLEEETGELLWEHRWSDFLSDTIYSRYAIGAPTIDPETGNVFSMTNGGLLHAFTPDGEMLWEVSTTEELGRLTFPNGRTGAPLILGDLVIMHFVFAAWGPLGPASDRFFAFDKHSGEVVWYSTPSGRPIDGSFSMPIVEKRGGRTLLYAGLGGGKVVCVNALNGDPIWRYELAIGGLNSANVIHGDKLIAINGKEQVGSSKIGCMVALDLNAVPDENGDLPPEAELWRNDLCAFTSSPVLVGDRVYATDATGDLNCVDVETGEVLWHEKLGPDQLHASPVYADGKLYVPITNGSFYVIRPTDEGAQVLDVEQLEGNCLGAPAVANGRVYVHTTKGLYCFGERKGGAPTWKPYVPEPTGEPARLQFVPADVTFRQNVDEVPFRVRTLDAVGNVVDEVPVADVVLEGPPFVDTSGGTWSSSRAGVAMVRGTYEGMTGSARVRTVPELPFVEDFSGYTLDQMDGTWAWPPGHWLGGRMKWQVVHRDGEPMIQRRMDNPLFQRTLSLFGHKDDANYTVQADVMSDGGRRSMSSVGLVNQRYLVILRGNYQDLEVQSNEEHLKVSVPFEWKSGVWHTLRTRVDVQPDGTAVVRAKAWVRGEEEPAAWTIEVPDPHGNTHGAAGVYGFTPQSRYTVYIDNLSVTPNE